MKKILGIILVGTTLNIFAVTESETCAPVAAKIDITQSVKWYHDSAEKKALYNQTYLSGSQYVRQWVKMYHPKANSWGVVLDIDETVLDNSWYMKKCGGLFESENDFSHYIANRQKSVALPGAAAFTHMVHEKGGLVSLVSNRDGSFKDSSGSVMEATIANLKAQQIYFDQVVLSNNLEDKTSHDKNPRFTAIISGKYNSTRMVYSKILPPHKVIAYFGDNIQDFPNLQQATTSNLDANDQVFKRFGAGNFILPNPMYGSW